MKVKPGFKIRTVCGENIIVAEGKENIDFSNIISMNESSAFLWEKVQTMESFTIDDLAQLLMSEYDVDAETATKDSETLVEQWATAKIIEGDDIPTADDVFMERETATETASSSQKGDEKPGKRSLLHRLFGKN